MDFSAYLELAALETKAPGVALQVASDIELPADLFSYRVPELGENGSCSLPGLLADQPYSLADALAGSGAQQRQLLIRLHGLLQGANATLQADWLGIYWRWQRPGQEAVLVKLAYLGAPSRAEFPLTESFAQLSNNVQVGLSGKARLIAKLDDYLADGGIYYNCDAKVRSEACLPLFAADGRVIGIIDAESFRDEHFTAERLGILTQLCLLAQKELEQLNMRH